MPSAGNVGTVRLRNAPRATARSGASALASLACWDPAPSRDDTHFAPAQKATTCGCEHRGPRTIYSAWMSATLSSAWADPTRSSLAAIACAAVSGSVQPAESSPRPDNRCPVRHPASAVAESFSRWCKKTRANDHDAQRLLQSVSPPECCRLRGRAWVCVDDRGPQPLAQTLSRVLRHGGGEGRCALQLRLAGGHVVVGSSSSAPAIQQETLDAAGFLFDLVLGARDRKSTRLNSSHSRASRMPSSA